ncbi:MAG: hypothetical protein Q4B58_07605 [Bacteroidales bacterium]|nr:hypothetical protein [Bacteroidales bacterium]
MKQVKLTPQESSKNLGAVIQLGHASLPIHGYYDFSMKVPTEVLDTLRNPQQLYLVNLDGGYVGGKYEKGCVVASVREFGRFALRRDASKPNATFVQCSWNKAQLSVTDTGSGIKQFKVWIDDKFVPFDMDNRGRYFGYPKHFGIQRGKQHQVRIWLIDRCGNENIIETTKFF